MAFSSKEKEIAYRNRYYQENKGKIALKNKIYYQKNKERIKLLTKQYKQVNKSEVQNKQKLYRKEYGLVNKNIIAIKRRKHNQNLRFKVLNFYSQGKMSCECCGENIIEFLTLDHINNDGHKQRKELGCSLSLYSWVIKNNFPEGFQVLCYNCNCGRSTRADKTCPHKNSQDNDRFCHPRGLPIEVMKRNVDNLTPLILRVDGSKLKIRK